MSWLRRSAQMWLSQVGSKTAFEGSVVCVAVVVPSKVSGESPRIVRVGRFGQGTKSKWIYCRSMVIEDAARLVCGALLPRSRWCREQLQP